MDIFRRKVSVIVPVYNAGNYLRECLDSLVNQSIDKELMEVILVDDGSTDDSVMICRFYSEIFPFFYLYTKENTGVSDTRNYAIDRAEGKYLFFLDSDDTLTSETIEKVTDFFDTVYNEVDLVTYKIVPYQNGKPLKSHYRYQYVPHSGVYNVDDIPLFGQTTMNIVVKKSEKRFSTELSRSEDQKYIMEHLMQSRKIGYCEFGEYRYTKNGEGAVGSMSYSYYMFEQQTPLFESFVRDNPDSKYVQGLILGNYKWMLLSDCIFPYHYDGEKWNDALNRINNLVDYIDVDTILKMPEMDNFHKHYWISMKRNISPAVICDDEAISVFVGEKRIYYKKGLEIIVNKVTANSECGYIMGFVKSPVFNYTDEEPVVYGIVNGKEYIINVFESISSHYKTYAKTNRFYAFQFEFPLDKNTEVYFGVELSGIKYNTSLYLTDSTGLAANLGIKKKLRAKYEILVENNIFRYLEYSGNAIQDINRELFLKNTEVLSVRDMATNIKSVGNEIWLYCDSKAIGTDNGYLQFIHDWNKDDDIIRYYVYMDNLEEIIDKFTEEQRQNLIAFGSKMHKVLFLASKYVICSFVDFHPRVPFSTVSEYAYYRDMQQPLVIYVGHGVLHADLTYMMSAERCKIDKFVISTNLEKKVLIDDYHYREKDILLTGAPRYDFINPNTPAKNRVLFAPSWRKYLADRYAGSNMTNYRLLKESKYFSAIMEFLSLPELHSLLEKNDMYLDVKLHQNAMNVVNELESVSPRIVFLEDKACVEDYKVFITDISSYAFDMAYLRRPMIYFMPDMDEFKSGMHSYRKLHLPLGKGFGKVCEEATGVLEELQKIIDNQCTIESVYLERINNIFIPLNQCREKLYLSLTK